MLMFLFHKMVVGYQNGEAEFVNLLENNIICFIPFVNIDGYQHIVRKFKETKKLTMVRKNRNNGTSNCPRE